MPEGHSIHRLARQFRDVFMHERLRVSSPQGRFADGAALLDGGTLVDARAHGKHLFLGFGAEPSAAADRILRVHLGIYGAFSFGGDETFRGASSIGAPRRVGETEIPGLDLDDGGPGGYSGPPEPVGQVRARLVSGHGWADLRGPAACEVITPAEAEAVVARLGPDPLVPGTDPQNFLDRVRGRRVALGQLLMDQSVAAGVGNIYRAEALYRAGLDPWLPGKLLGDEAGLRLWEDLVALMADGVRVGRIITTRPEHRNTVDQDGQLAPVWPDNAYYVYRRDGLGCRVCGTEVHLARMQARNLFWCPVCQAPPAPREARDLTR